MTSSDDLQRTIRRNKPFGIWAADKLGIAGRNGEAYSDALAMHARSRAQRRVQHNPATGVNPLPWISVVVAAALVLGATNMTTHMAFARGMSGAAHFVGGGFAGRRFPISHFVRPFRRNFAFRNDFAFHRNFTTGGLWPYYYDYFPTDLYRDMDTTTYPETGGFAPAPMPVHVCHRSEEIVRVPREGGGKPANIKIIRCP
jgi:hypothetical protein